MIFGKFHLFIQCRSRDMFMGSQKYFRRILKSRKTNYVGQRDVNVHRSKTIVTLQLPTLNR